MRDELVPTFAVRPLALSQQHGQMTLVLEDPGGETLDGILRGPLEITQFLRLAIGIALALCSVRKRSLIHKDLKPSNALADTATGDARLTGFGIASRLPRATSLPRLPSSSLEHFPTWRPNRPDG